MIIIDKNINMKFLLCIFPITITPNDKIKFFSINYYYYKLLRINQIKHTGS